MKVKGYVKIGGHDVIKNQIQPDFVNTIIQYMVLGGELGNYKYTIQLMSNKNVIGAYSGSLQYRQVGSTLQLQFTFIIPNAPTSVTCLQLYLLNSMANFLVSVVKLSKPLPSGVISICWFLCFQISPADYFTPYIIFSFFGPPSSDVPFIGTPLPNVQTAINEIKTVGYLTTIPTYYFVYSGNRVKLKPQTTSNSFLVTYKLLSNSSQQLTNVGIVATASNGDVILIPQVPTITLKAGQVLFATYSVLWET